MDTLKTKTSKTKGPVLETILNAAPRNFKLSSTFLHLNKWWLKEAPYFFIFYFVFCCCCHLFSLFSGFYISKISSGGFYPITSSCLPLSPTDLSSIQVPQVLSYRLYVSCWV